MAAADEEAWQAAWACEESPPVSAKFSQDAAAALHDKSPEQGGKPGKPKQQKRTGPKKKAAPGPAKLCKVLNCSMFAKDGKTRCEGHNRTYDCMMYQANKDGELETLEKVLGDPEKEFTAMSDFVKETPPHDLFIRKGRSNKWVNWACFKQLYGVRKSKIEQEVDVPKTEEEFEKWATEQRNMTAEGARNWWRELKLDTDVQRDKKGRDQHGRLGELRLWVPNAEERCIRQKETYADRQVENEQFRLKYANEDELEALRAHARTQPPEALAFVNAPAPATQDSAMMQPVESPQKKARVEEPATVEPMTQSPGGSGQKTTTVAKAEQPPIDLASYRSVGARSQTKDMEACRNLINDALQDTNKAADLCASFKATTAADGQTADEAMITSDFDTTMLYRKACCKAWLDEDPTVLKDQVKEQTVLLPVANPSALLNMYDMREMIISLKSVETHEAAVAAKNAFEQAFKMVAQLAKGTTKSALDLSSHVKALPKEIARRQKQAEAEKQKQMQQQAKEAGRRAAAQATAGAAGGAKILQPLYKVSVGDYTGMTEVTDLEGPMNWDEPWCCHAAPSVGACVADDKVSRVLSAFTKNYKAEESYKVTGRSVGPMLPKQGKELVDEMIEGFKMPVLDVSTVAGGPNFMANTWLWGLDPDLPWSGIMPNAAPCMMIGTIGKMDMILFNIESCRALGLAQLERFRTQNDVFRNKRVLNVLDECFNEKCVWNMRYVSNLCVLRVASRAGGGRAYFCSGADCVTIEMVRKKLLGLDSEGIKQAMENGVKAKKCSVQPLTAVYSPGGWLVVQISTEGPSVCGIRKSVFVNTLGHKTVYAQLQVLFKNAKQGFADKLKEIQPLVNATA